MADIDGNENDNSITGTSGADNIKGNGGADTIAGSGGDDTLSGGSGNDDIDGGSGNDTIFGGNGDDTITGGRGDDTIIGGRGDDVMSAGNNSPSDTFVIRDGDGNDTITDFDPSEPDIIRFDMAEMSTYQDVSDRMSQDGNDTIITYNNGSSVRLLNVNSADLSSTNFQFAPGPVCLAEGTLIQTPTGQKRVELLKAGDTVITIDHGPQPIVHVLAERISFKSREDRRKPILIAKGALGHKLPQRDIIASPQHRFVLPDNKNGCDVLVAAVKLINRSGIRRMLGCRAITYYNLLMAKHEIILANGCQVETMLVTPFSLMKLADLNVCLKPNQTMMKPARDLMLCDIVGQNPRRAVTS